MFWPEKPAAHNCRIDAILHLVGAFYARANNHADIVKESNAVSTASTYSELPISVTLLLRLSFNDRNIFADKASTHKWILRFVVVGVKVDFPRLRS